MTTPTFVHAVAIVYGLVLVGATFLRTPITEAMRVDALFLPGASESTRPINVVFGLLVAGYAAWSLLAG